MSKSSVLRIGGMLLGASWLALAQLAHSQSLLLEEIVVTATKRAEGLQDVPISMSVMSGQKIEQQGISELEDLAIFMPNVHVAEGGTGTQLFIRGIGSGINFGFEQSVGTFIDGVYYGRGRNARAAFLDLERVEILKGSQSTLFGKNTIAGAINITSAKPTDEFEAYIQGTYETEVDGVGFTGMVSGPLSDSVRGRLVAKVYEDDGYVENTFSSEDGPAEKNQFVRGTLVWDVNDALSLTFKAEHGQFDIDGRQDQISIASDFALSQYRDPVVGDPNFDAAFNYQKSSRNVDGPGVRGPQFDDTEASVIQLTADYQMGEHTLRSITAYTEYEYVNYQDADYGPLQFLAAQRIEEHEQFSQEFLLTSPAGGTLEYLAGVYYQDNDLLDNEILDVLFSNVPILAAQGLGGFNGTGHGLFQQETQTWSVFTELTWNITDTFRATFGIRYSDDHKEMTKSNAIGPLFDTTAVADPTLCFVYENVLALAACHVFDENTPNFNNTRDEEHVTGSLNLQLDLSDDIMTYLTIGNGYKGGGYDESNRLGLVANEEFEDENVNAIEIGSKMVLWDGRAQFNVAAFYSEYEDVQVSTFDGNCCFVVGNAAETEVKGIETDWMIAATEALTLSGGLAILDASYKSFPDAACNAFQIADGSCAANGGVQDLSGQSLQFAPDWAANLGAEYQRALNDALDLRLGLEVNWSDKVVVANDLDPNIIQDSYFKANARIALAASDDSWSLALIGKNITDEETFSWGNDVPLGGLGFAFTYFQHIDPPRTLELQARYNF